VYSLEDDLIGKSLDGRFTVRDLLGKGGMGAVYRAQQHSMDRDVALKVLRRDMAQNEDAVKRFFREARAVSKLASPHTITVFDFGQTDDGLLYIAMELLRGRPLNRVLSELAAPMEPAKAVSIAQQILESLIEAHSVGIIHRDLKPDNVFVLEGKGRNEFVKVLDFGIAKLTGTDGTGSQLTGTGVAFGTPTYMSPEQAQAKELDPRTDLYSLGVILFEMLAGKPPFEGQTPLAVMMQKVQGQSPTVFHVNPEVRIPLRLERLLASLLAQDRDDRPPNAEAVTLALAEVFDESSGDRVPIPDVVVSQGTTSQVTVIGGKKGDRKHNTGRVQDVVTGVIRLDGEGLAGQGKGRPWKWIAVAGGAVALAVVAAFLLGRGAPLPEGSPAPAIAAPVSVPIVPVQPPPVPVSNAVPGDEAAAVAIPVVPAALVPVKRAPDPPVRKAAPQPKKAKAPDLRLKLDD
jgi:serine/threonine-protein kinase